MKRHYDHMMLSIEHGGWMDRAALKAAGHWVGMNRLTGPTPANARERRYLWRECIAEIRRRMK